MRMGGSQSKGLDQILTSVINDGTGAKPRDIAFKSGG